MTPRKARVGAPALVRTVSDLRALAHPLRLRMMELFAEQPRTTKQVADLLGQPPTRLYHHVAALERAGLLVLKETRPNRGVVEKWYAGVSHQYKASGRGSPKNKSTRAVRRALAATVLDQAKQELLAVPPGNPAPLLARMLVAIPPARLPAVRQRLYETIKELATELAPKQESTAEDDCERWALTFALTPTSSRRGRRSSR